MHWWIFLVGFVDVWRCSEGFLTTRYRSVIRDACLLLSTPREDNPRVANEKQRDIPATPSRRRRASDFPSFCYDTKKTVARRKPLQKSNPRSISVPSFESRTTFWEQIVLAILGPTSIRDDVAKRTRLLEGRSYANPEAFSMENIKRAPNLQDVSSGSLGPLEGIWVSLPFRAFVFGAAYSLFPGVTRFLDRFVTMPPAQLDEITSKFGPGVSILYGTFISLTLSILYDRQRELQTGVATECSILILVTRSLLHIFRKDSEKAIEAVQCTADQIRTLVRSSRGQELMMVMYSDPYSRILEIIDRHEEEEWRNNGSTDNTANVVAYTRDLLRESHKTRAKRLSDEALALPPTHFLILNSLTSLILLGYTISILPTVDRFGTPSNESSILFGLLCSIYVSFFNFATDLNSPFMGVYQIRRSCAASHLLEIKWLIANHPLVRGQIDFEEPEEDSDQLLVRSPGLGEFLFERDEFFLDNADEKEDEALKD